MVLPEPPRGAHLTQDAELVLVDSAEEAQAFLSWLGERRPILAFDLETSGLDPFREEVRLAQFGDGRTGWAIPYRDWRGLVRHVMDRYEGPIAAHNGKFDASFLAVDGIRVPRHRMHETMVMTALDDNLAPKGLKSAAARHLGRWALVGQRELKDGMKKAKWDWRTVPTDFEPYWKYAALDTVLTARLAERLWPRVQGSREAYEREVAAQWVLLDMELRGMRVDLEYCQRTYSRVERELAEVQSRWPDVNLFSTEQVASLLRQDGVRLMARTAKGNVQLDEAVLSHVDHPLARDCLAARELRKINSTYIGAYLDLQVDGVLHPNINPLGAEKTGRMSISRPSMQNLPRRAIVRDAFVARDGHRLVLADYQAQELRVLAHYAQDRRMIEAFASGEDLHTSTARTIYGVEEPSKKQRQTVKSASYAKVYGAGPEKFAATAGITVPESKAFMSRYDAMFPGIVRFMSTAQRTVRDRAAGGPAGWLRTLGGRVLKVPTDRLYVAVNYAVQGSCSDMMKQAIVNLDRAGAAQHLVLPVHDEAVFDAPESDVEELERLAHECMEPQDLSVPMPVEIEVVDRWGDRYE